MINLPGNAIKYHIENVTVDEKSPLKGKRMLFLGSSVTFGYAALECSMADYIGAVDGCEIVKEAVNGTTLVDKDEQSYVRRLKSLDINQHFDAVVVQLSTNDATQAFPLGELNDNKISFDTMTVTGAIEEIISYVKNTWACPVFFYTGSRYDSENYAKMVERLLEIAVKWDIRVIDLWSDEALNSISPEEYALYMLDPIHPTQAGYLCWWLPKFRENLQAWVC